MLKRFIILIILLALITAGFVGFDMFRKKMMGQVFSAMAVAPITNVTVMTTEVKPIPRTLEGVGSLSAEQQVSVTAETGGKITRIAFKDGQDVKKGDLLIQLNDTAERADLQRAEAQANLARINLGRAQKLLAIATPQAKVDEYKSTVAEAQANISQIRSAIDKKSITAPFSGTLGIAQADIGQFVNPGDMLISLTDLSTLHVNFNLPEQARAMLEVGQDVTVSTDVYPDTKFLATLSAFDPVISEATRTIRVQATMDNPDNQLNPGMFVRAGVQLPAAEPAISLPETAVEFSIYGDSVFVLSDVTDDDIKAMESAPTFPGAPPVKVEKDKTFKVKRVYVKTGTRFDGQVVILEGLKENDRVVTTGQINLTNDSKVKIVEPAAVAGDAPTDLPAY
ncbi:MAG: efflux RND transporter periplasmic adaptor subunit [Pseudomonadota bacterium]